MSTAIDTTWADIERMVYGQCWWFVDHFGGEFDDYLGPAHEAFMAAYAKFNPERGAFTTLLWWSVRNKLLSFVKRQRRIQDNEVEANEEKYLQTPERQKFGIGKVLEELPEDGRVVVRLLLDDWTPKKAKGLNGRAQREVAGSMRSKLWDDFGWGMGQITEAFSEVREVLR